MSDFNIFAKHVKDRFEQMHKGGEPVFVVDLIPDELWDFYQNSFPQGTNEIFRERRAHDCTTCRHFVRNIGGAVTVDAEGELETVWGGNGAQALQEPYRTVAERMNEIVRYAPIKNLLVSDHSRYGQESTVEVNAVTGKTITWNHFSAVLPNSMCHHSPAAAQGTTLETAQMFIRACREFAFEDLALVRELCENGSLYRGETHTQVLKDFKRLMERVHNTESVRNGEHIAWRIAATEKPGVTRVRNTSIGTLLQDLAAYVPLEDAVRKYEAMVAPENYQRPTALITEGMVDSALDKLDELGLRGAVDRRHARVSDISVTDVMFVDNDTRGVMLDPLKETLLSGASKKKPSKAKKSKAQATNVTIDDFVDLMASSPEGPFDTMEILLEPSLVGNLVSVTAPVSPTKNSLFAWGNDYGWSYFGGAADSIDKRISDAGGKLDGAWRASLFWEYKDDLDLHVRTPRGEIYFGQQTLWGGGPKLLDVDMNRNAGEATDKAAENIVWPRHVAPLEGDYEAYVHNYKSRTERPRMSEAFTFKFVTDKEEHHKSFSHRMSTDAMRKVCTWRVDHGEIKDLVFGECEDVNTNQTVWGLDTGEYVRVKAMFNSPNWWKNAAVGMKHWIFALEGCQNPDPVRSFYNEFLTSDLKRHRKVFEHLAARSCAPFSEDQVSGIGITKGRSQALSIRLKRDGRIYKFRVSF